MRRMVAFIGLVWMATALSHGALAQQRGTDDATFSGTEAGAAREATPTDAPAAPADATATAVATPVAEPDGPAASGVKDKAPREAPRVEAKRREQPGSRERGDNSFQKERIASTEKIPAAPARSNPPPPPEGTSQEADDIVVVGRRTEVSAFSSERSVSMVTERNMEEALPRTTPEALWDSAGVFVQETNFGGGAPIIRGLVGPQILLVYDGVRLNNSVYRTGPNQYLTLVDPFYVSRMEVLRGAGSVLYGSDAMGGVIYLHGPTRPDLTSFKMVGRVGSAALEKTGHTAVTMASERGAVYFGGAIHSYADLRAGRNIGVQPLSGYDVYSAAAKGWMSLPAGLDLTVGVLYTDIEGAGRTDKLWVKGKYQEYDNVETMMYARVFKDLGMWDVSLTSSFQDFYENKRTYSMDVETLRKLSEKSDEMRVYTWGLDLKVRGEVSPALSLVSGALYYHDFVHSNRYLNPDMMSWIPSDVTDYPDGSTYSRYGVFGYGVWDAATMLSGSVRVTAGWRLQGVSADAPARGELEATEFSFFGNTLHASVQHIVPKRTNVGLVFSQGFRAPNLQEAVMLGDAGKYFHAPNPDLEPEKMHSLEAYARVRHGRVQGSVTGYVSYIDGILKREHTEWDGQTEIDGKPVVQHVNGDHAIITGLEAQASAYLGRGVSVRANATWTRGTEYRDDGDVPLSKIPPLFGYVGLRKSALVLSGIGYAETYVRWATKQDRLSPADMEDPRIPEGGTPGWWTWNIRMGYRSEDLIVSLVVENILDRTYKYHGSGIYAPGTNALVQLTWLSF